MAGILIIVENLPVPFDRRVWSEATALRRAGHTVSVICPTGRDAEARYAEIDGIHVYRHPLPHEGHGALGYLVEYASALFWGQGAQGVEVGFEAVEGGEGEHGW